MPKGVRLPCWIGLVLCAALFACPALCTAQTPTPTQPLTALAPGPRRELAAATQPQTRSEQVRSRLRTVGRGLAGFATGFFAHEAGHLVTNVMLGNVPQIQGFFVWGFIPFFAIAPRIDCVHGKCTKWNGENFGPGPRGKYAIVSAGYEVQHISDEIILSRAPNIRAEYAPYRKGILLFNVFLSCMYAAASLTGTQDPHGDLAGMTRASGYDHVFLSAALLLPAVLDTVRYALPRTSRWSAWASRGSKLLFVGINVSF
jgi:hypothetical protein